MPGYVFSNYLVFCFINAFTPGPGNLLALNTVTNYGIRKGRPLFLGIFTGYIAVQTICAFFVYAVGTVAPGFLNILKYVGAAYILWLAVHIAVSVPKEESDRQSASFVKGFLLQLVNVKVFLFGLTALTGFVVEYGQSLPFLLTFGSIVAGMGILATATWIGLGALIQKFYRKHYRILNIIMALTLLECIVSMFR